MDIGIIARRYARALLLFACGNGSEDAVYGQVRQLLSRYDGMPELRRTIGNPMVGREEKSKLLRAAAGEETCAELSGFFCLLLENRREKLLPFILHSFLSLYREKKKILRGKLVTAVPLPEKTLNELKTLILKRYPGNTVEFDTKVNPDIIGGGILEIGYLRCDASIAGQLERVRKQFIEKNRRIV